LLQIAFSSSWFAEILSGLFLLIVGAALGFGIAGKKSQRNRNQQEKSFRIPTATVYNDPGNSDKKAERIKGQIG
jgi:hypothetical protein